MTIGKVPERGPVGIAALDSAHHLLGGPVGGVQLLGQVPGTCAVFIVAHTVVEMTPRFSIGVIHFRAYEDLERCLASLKVQLAMPESIIVTGSSTIR